MIINIRGTSGSGKSTVIRRLMEMAVVRPTHVDGRKQPLWYDLMHPDHDEPVTVLGHYESDCGGCDTITDGLDTIYELVEEAADAGNHVLYEGLLVQSDVKRCIALAETYGVIVIGLNTNFETCLEGIRARRLGRGNHKPMNIANTVNKMRPLPRQRERLSEAGVDWRDLNREEAFDTCLTAFRWK